MAIPPQDAPELFRWMSCAIRATVVEEIERGPSREFHAAPRGSVGPIAPDPWQILRLQLIALVLPEMPLIATPGVDEIVVFKPEAPYSLQAGSDGTWGGKGGVFLLSGRLRAEPKHPMILGRYGPWYYSVDGDARRGVRSAWRGFPARHRPPLEFPPARHPDRPDPWLLEFADLRIPRPDPGSPEEAAGPRRRWFRRARRPH